jgi:serine/threonine protein kinase
MTLPGDSSFDRTLGAQAYSAGPPPGHAGSAHALPVGHRLGELQIERVLGEGGFGIVYLAHDIQLGRHVALKEYMPGSMAGRGPGLSVALRSEHDRSTFELGLRSFVNEARLLAQLDHPALVKVHRFWEERGTAYMVMPYYQGQTLRQWLRARLDGPEGPDEAWLRALLEPLLDVLAYLHSQNIYHRDVSPENILLLADGRPVLLDFGAARLIVGDATQNLTAILKQGYAPVEQYAESTATKQGAWTDLYALGAVLYFVVSGKAPTASVARLVNDDLPSAVQVGQGRYSSGLLGWIDACLAVRPEQRPPDVAAARRLLRQSGETGDRPVVAKTLPAERPDAMLTAVPTGMDGGASALPPRLSPTRWGWAAVAFTLGLGLVVAAGLTGRLNVPQSGSIAEPQPAATALPVPATPATPAPAPAPASVAEPKPVVPPSPAPTSASLDRPLPSAGAPAAAASAAMPVPVPAKAAAVPSALPRGEASRQAAQCADLLQSLSLGEDSPALRQKLASLRCQ